MLYAYVTIVCLLAITVKHNRSESELPAKEVDNTGMVLCIVLLYGVC